MANVYENVYGACVCVCDVVLCVGLFEISGASCYYQVNLYVNRDFIQILITYILGQMLSVKPFNNKFIIHSDVYLPL